MVTAPYKRLNLFSFNFGSITILHVISSYGTFLFFSIATDLYIYFTGSIFFYFFVGLNQGPVSTKIALFIIIKGSSPVTRD